MKKRTKAIQSKPAKQATKAKPKAVSTKQSPKKKAKPKAERRYVTVSIKTERHGKSEPTYSQIDVPIMRGERVHFDLLMDLRKTSYVEIRPVRRSMDDVNGMLEDAERLANEPI